MKTSDLYNIAERFKDEYTGNGGFITYAPCALKILLPSDISGEMAYPYLFSDIGTFNHEIQNSDNQEDLEPLYVEMKAKTSGLIDYLATDEAATPMGQSVLSGMREAFCRYVEWFERVDDDDFENENFRDEAFDVWAVCKEWMPLIEKVLPPKEDGHIQKPQMDNRLKRAFEYCDKAVAVGMAEKTDDGYKWLYNNGSKASLAYFINKIFNPDGTGQIPFKKVEPLWGRGRLDTAVGSAMNAKYPQRWRQEIDDLFED